MNNSRSNPFPPICIRQYFNASAEEIFDAWINPEKIRQWMFKSEGDEIFRVDGDVHSGGSFSILERTAKGEVIDRFGKYFRVERPNNLSFSLEVPRHFTGITAVYIMIQARGEGCELTFQQIGVDPEVVEESWRSMFVNLASFVESAKTDSQFGTATL